MVEYICNRCGFGDDELDPGTNPLDVFEVKYEEFYCDSCMDEYNRGNWYFPKEWRELMQKWVRDKVAEERTGPTMGELYQYLRDHGHA